MSNKINSALFSAREHALDNEPCPQCQIGQLHLRHGKHGPFLACNQYPNCGYIKPLHHHDGHIVKILGVECPDCGHELVLRQGRFGMFIGCSSYPDCHYLSSPQAAEEKSPAVLGIECPECQSHHLVERKTRFGKTFFACDGYPKCKFALNSKPIAGPCSVCGYTLLVEKKSASGVRYQCANRKCQHLQDDRA
ncbi:DNA topoisomerase [Vibrio sp. SM6]|uniref:DNA topoisomerase n=1 Tax=Vibrio agarilyticus TaxID=2726741 RepID=A0A7X8TT24_9VIBR|nr:type I DNA topoisomerase [Vibrio agarilyticus]NLS14367.1 DNA topoisomerase [Vibrio agarilyticus]